MARCQLRGCGRRAFGIARLMARVRWSAFGGALSMPRCVSERQTAHLHRSAKRRSRRQAPTRIADSRSTMRSSSAQTSAMRPDIRMRPARADAWPASTMRTTRNGERTTRRDKAVAGGRAAGIVACRKADGRTGTVDGRHAAEGTERVGSQDDALLKWRSNRPRRFIQRPGVARVWFMVEASVVYINMVLRIRPTASPSISNGSPGSTTMVW